VLDIDVGVKESPSLEGKSECSFCAIGGLDMNEGVEEKIITFCKCPTLTCKRLRHTNERVPLNVVTRNNCSFKYRVVQIISILSAVLLSHLNVYGSAFHSSRRNPVAGLISRAQLASASN
jgi:hypothetical protein